jgi:hypothetical protein
MRFIRYNSENGDIVAYGYMEDVLVQAEIDAGQPSLPSDVVADFHTHKVDLETMTVVRRPQAEIDAAEAQFNIPPTPIVVPPSSPPQGE